jgi:ubiquitin C-terminal hydrolase
MTLPFSVAVDSEITLSEYKDLLGRFAKIPMPESRSAVDYAPIAREIYRKAQETYTQGVYDDAFILYARCLDMIEQRIWAQKHTLDADPRSEVTLAELRAIFKAAISQQEKITTSLLPKLFEQHMDEVRLNREHRQRIIAAQHRSAATEAASPLRPPPPQRGTAAEVEAAEQEHELQRQKLLERQAGSLFGGRAAAPRDQLPNFTPPPPASMPPPPRPSDPSQMNDEDRQRFIAERDREAAERMKRNIAAATIDHRLAETNGIPAASGPQPWSASYMAGRQSAMPAAHVAPTLAAVPPQQPQRPCTQNPAPPPVATTSPQAQPQQQRPQQPQPQPLFPPTQQLAQNHPPPQPLFAQRLGPMAPPAPVAPPMAQAKPAAPAWNLNGTPPPYPPPEAAPAQPSRPPEPAPATKLDASGSGPLITTPNPTQAVIAARTTMWPFAQPGGNQPRRRGLVNLGNTCYINSSLQCLAATALGGYFQTDHYVDSIADRYTGGGKIANTFTFVMRELRLSSPPGPISASNLKRWIAKVNPTFDNFSQQDASEFMKTLIHGLSEDLNPNRGKRGSGKDIENRARPDNAIARDYMDAHTQLNGSPFTELVQFQERQSIFCTRCKEAARSFPVTVGLELPIPSVLQRPISVEDCLAAYTKQERLSGDSAFNCATCRAKTDAIKQHTFYSTPGTLILTLKRFTVFDETANKNATEVAFQPELDIAPYVVGPIPPAGCRYRLVGVVNHQGTLGGGHYTADVRGPDGAWWYCSDEDVRPGVHPSFSKAYILLYQRTNRAASL